MFAHACPAHTPSSQIKSQIRVARGMENDEGMLFCLCWCGRPAVLPHNAYRDYAAAWRRGISPRHGAAAQHRGTAPQRSAAVQCRGAAPRRGSTAYRLPRPRGTRYRAALVCRPRNRGFRGAEQSNPRCFVPVRCRNAEKRRVMQTTRDALSKPRDPRFRWLTTSDANDE
jgi:hypothetical protein